MLDGHCVRAEQNVLSWEGRGGEGKEGEGRGEEEGEGEERCKSQRSLLEMELRSELPQRQHGRFGGIFKVLNVGGINVVHVISVQTK